MIDIQKIREQFPILHRRVNNQPLVYLDNAATVQKPQSVLDGIEIYYREYNANVHRGIHTLSREATELMEESRKKVQQFINAKNPYEVIFTSGTTDAINTVAYGMRFLLNKDDEIIVSQMEHHSNIVPWQMLAELTGAVVKFIPMNPNGELRLDILDELLNDRTKLVSVNHISNALGIINPIKKIIEKAHAYGAWVLIDGAQAIAHEMVDVQALDADFYCFSGHKMYGATGTGILYGKEDYLNQLAPFKGGGEMIKEVTLSGTTYADLPFKFEAGTPNIAGNIVMSKAIDFIQNIGLNKIGKHESELVNHLIQELQKIEEVVIYGKDIPRAGAVSFNVQVAGVHPSDVGMILDQQGIAVRTGHHCCQPIMQFFDIPGTVRASFAVYNTLEEVDVFISGLKRAIQMLK